MTLLGKSVIFLRRAQKNDEGWGWMGRDGDEIYTGEILWKFDGNSKSGE